MAETIFAYVSTYGLPLIALSAYLSCLAVPIPTFAVMLTGGAFAATGDLVTWQVVATAYGAAVLGDQTGFHLGRWGGPRVIARIGRGQRRAALVARARETLLRWGGIGVFLSTWAVAPLGPWVNLVAGAAGMRWARFTAWDAAGEAIWVAGYVGLGYALGARLPALVELVGDWAGLVSSAAITLILGTMLLRAALRHRRERRAGRTG